MEHWDRDPHLVDSSTQISTWTLEFFSLLEYVCNRSSRGSSSRGRLRFEPALPIRSELRKQFYLLLSRHVFPRPRKKRNFIPIRTGYSIQCRLKSHSILFSSSLVPFDKFCRHAYLSNQCIHARNIHARSYIQYV